MDQYTADVSEILKRPQVADEGQLGRDHPSAYRPEMGLVAAVNVALLLKRPLLLTGDPGTGKTQLAYSLAWQLARRGRLKSASVKKFETKSTSVAKDLFYSFDAVGRFHAPHNGGSTKNVDYITYKALGLAILDALPLEKVKTFLPPPHLPREPKRSVVLIDEIDKAPRDFPNDLLNEIDHMYFRVPELGNDTIGGPEVDWEEMKPIVVITSNSERTLPDPFLRRCIYYNINFPDPEKLEEILVARLANLHTSSPLLEDALAFFQRLRERNVTRRKISPAELIQWLAYMLASNVTSQTRLRDAQARPQEGLVAMIKDPEDQKKVAKELQSFLAGA